MTQSTDIYGVADYLDIPVATVRRRIKAGTFPPPDAQQNGTEWWDIESLDKYQRKLKRQAAAKRKKIT